MHSLFLFLFVMKNSAGMQEPGTLLLCMELKGRPWDENTRTPLQHASATARMPGGSSGFAGVESLLIVCGSWCWSL
ncbi:hypothetical protein AKJ16_DCAP08686 [Drosera capensis]